MSQLHIHRNLKGLLAMIMENSPENMDIMWMAIDKNDHVAVFFTGGPGPLPYNELGTPPTLVNSERSGVMDAMFDLPCISKAILEVQPKSPLFFLM